MIGLTITCNTLLLAGMGAIGWWLWNHEDGDPCQRTKKAESRRNWETRRPVFAFSNRIARRSRGRWRHYPRRALLMKKNGLLWGPRRRP